MSRLNLIVESLLKDIIEAQHAANCHAASLARQYGKRGRACGFPLPSAQIGSLEFDLKYAVTGTSGVEEKQVADTEQWSLFRQEFLAELDKPHRIYGTKKLDVVTGTMAAPLIIEMMEELHRQYPMVEVTVHTIKNKFFGGNVGVAGLVTATDIIAQCEGKLTSGTLGVPAVMLREEKDTFLDDITTDQLAQRLGVKVEVLPTSGGDEARALLRSGLHIARRRRA